VAIILTTMQISKNKCFFGESASIKYHHSVKPSRLIQISVINRGDPS
jgi:hypothetical protein